MKMLTELKPCPFCGSIKLKVERKSTLVGYNGLDHRVKQHTYSVRCNVCHARGGAVGGKVIPHFKYFTGGKLPLPDWATTDEVLQNSAIEAWNRRAGDTDG